jgi:hypothetical protein
MFTITCDGSVVTDITFAGEPRPGKRQVSFGPADHVERAAELVRSGAEVASIILVVAPLEAELWDDVRYASWTARVGACEARVEARRRLMNRRFGPDEVTARARALNFPEVSGSDVEDVGYRTQLVDAIVEEDEVLAMLDVLDDAREECRFDWDDDDVDDEPRELDAEEAASRWRTRKAELVAPQPLIERHRRYHLPAPLDGDRRSSVQQWYFVAAGTEIEWYRGSSSSSGSREDHGRWAHTFGTLTKDYGIAVPTLVLLYDSQNVLRLVRESPGLLVDGADLVGNYQFDYGASERLLEPFKIDTRRLSM